MLDTTLAEKFIDKIRDYISFNINIMNDKGIIIASRDPSRIGSFHEIAYHIITGDKDLIEVAEDDNYLGSKNGINMAFVYRKSKIGVIGVTGKPEEVRNIALIIKMSMETMLEYEIQNEQIHQRKNLKTQFLDSLLYLDNADSEGELSAFANRLGYQPDLIRIPVLIIFHQQLDSNLLLKKIKESSLHSSQDISSVTRENQIVIFKSFTKSSEDLFSHYRYFMGEYLSDFLQFIRSEELNCKFYIGTFQTAFTNYRKSYQHCLWLSKNCNATNMGNFFYDYVGDYMKSILPMMELHKIYGVYSDLLEHEFKSNLMETVRAMHNNNYNLNTSSKDLFVHKNTLVFRYNKIKKQFDINPVQNLKEREFLEYMFYYFDKIK